MAGNAQDSEPDARTGIFLASPADTLTVTICKPIEEPLGDAECTVYESSDFVIAGRNTQVGADFELRGPGDVLGTRQHGDLPLKVADLVRDHAILREARKAAFNLVETGRFDDPTFAPLKIHVLERFQKQMELVASG